MDEPDFEAVFNEKEMLGLRLFSGFPGTERNSLGCIACHQTSAHSMDQAHVNGLDADTSSDQGQVMASSSRPHYAILV